MWITLFGQVRKLLYLSGGVSFFRLTKKEPIEKGSSFLPPLTYTKTKTMILKLLVTAIGVETSTH